MNAADDDGLSPLHLACVGGHAAVAKELLDAGALPEEVLAVLIQEYHLEETEIELKDTYDQDMDSVTSEEIEHELVMKAKQKELGMLNQMDTYDVIDRPKEAKAISSRWVLREKKEGTVRARFVAREYKLNKGVHDMEVYAATPSLKAMRTLLTVCSSKMQEGKSWGVLKDSQG